VNLSNAAALTQVACLQVVMACFTFWDYILKKFMENAVKWSETGNKMIITSVIASSFGNGY